MKHFRKHETGAAAVEYAFILGLIALVIVASVQTIGTTTQGFFETAASWFPSAS